VILVQMDNILDACSPPDFSPLERVMSHPPEQTLNKYHDHIILAWLCNGLYVYQRALGWPTDHRFWQSDWNRWALWIGFCEQ